MALPGVRDQYRHRPAAVSFKPVTGLTPGWRTASATPKDTGLGRLPSREFALNQAWLAAVMIAADLVAWTRMLACTGDAEVLALCEPKALRYRFLHVAARLVRSGRRRRIKIPETWPWATAIVAVVNKIAAIHKPA
ncbi:hypothetical protein GCM10022294_06990 [Dietzia aurantiaca]|uniref:Transposase n=1 Tax=Dietzia aurantiaca TaxID=983873 RepID=A0ABV9PK70_9ACTN